jgi:hypothetical protein
MGYWNIESVLLEKLTEQEARLAVDPKEIHAEQISSRGARKKEEINAGRRKPGDLAS